jgi:hypothetical protein
MSAEIRLRALDDPAGHRRTTRSLVASLAARLGVLGYVTGGQAIGSHLAGIAALGREIARTEDGERLLAGLERNRAGVNGEALWDALHIDGWLSSMPPSPVLDELRNDLALLMADDLEQILGGPSDAAAVPTATLAEPRPVCFTEVMLGLWAWGRELTRAVEAAAGTSAAHHLTVIDRRGDGPGLEGPVLR